MSRVIIVMMAFALLVVPSEVTARPAQDTITVLQLNICHGGMNNCYRGDAVLTKAAEVISANKPQVLSINEACRGDIARLRQAMGPARALFVAAHNLDGTPTRCRDGDQYGNIVMVTDRLATTERSGMYRAQRRDPAGHKELRAWACLIGPTLSACTTHLSSDSDRTALAQCQDLIRRAAGYPRPTVVAGDFNLDDQGSPSMRDCDPAGFSRRGDGGVQHTYAGDDLTFTRTTKIDMMGTTDHPGLLTTLTHDRSVDDQLSP